LAGVVAGQVNPLLQEAWAADLRPESGQRAMSLSHGLFLGMGYLRAALVLRLTDTDSAEPLLRLLDAAVRTGKRVRVINTVIVGGTFIWLIFAAGPITTIGDLVSMPILWAGLKKTADWYRHARKLDEGEKPSEDADSSS
jgi:hypothetical protein